MSPEVFEIVFPYWLKSFVLTLVVEIPIFVLVARFRVLRKQHGSLIRQVLAAACGTCVTHPLLWFVWPFVVTDYTLYLASGELIIAVVESFSFFAVARPISLRRAAAASFIANGISFGGGLLLNSLVSFA